MRYFVVFIFMAFLMFNSCNNNALELTVSGEVKGLKKGTLYLERLSDTSLVVLDSSVVLGDPKFEFSLALDEPEVLYLSLDANSEEEPRIAFFADSGQTQINTTLKRFFHDANIKGSEEQALWNQYKGMISNFTNENLDLIKAELEFAQDSVKLDSINTLQQRNLVRRYQYTINFAKTNSNSAISPYLLLTEVSNANVRYLDTVYKSLTPEITASKYGKELKELIDSAKN